MRDLIFFFNIKSNIIHTHTHTHFYEAYQYKICPESRSEGTYLADARRRLPTEVMHSLHAAFLFLEYACMEQQR